MIVLAIDCSHVDRPSLEFQAHEVISSRTGTLILMPSIPDGDYFGAATSIANLARDIRQGFDLTLSHDWVVKVHD